MIESDDVLLSFGFGLEPPNDQGNPAAAENRRFQNPPDPPLGLTALLGRILLTIQQPWANGTAA